MAMRNRWKIVRFLTYIVLGVQAALLTACKPDYPPYHKPILHTTISADGQMVATLLNAGTDKQLLRIRHLATDTTWRTVSAPPFTRSIRFAGQGHELLLTYNLPQAKLDVLAKLDLDKPDAPAMKFYEAEHLAFPVEVGPGQVMVRTRKAQGPNDGTQQSDLSGYHWILVGPGPQVQKVRPDSVSPYAAPDIVGNGFFWTEDQIGKEQEAHPILMSFSLPGGRAPEIPRERLQKDTFKLRCDRSATRCLRSFIANLDQRPATSFIYDVEVLLGSERCKLPGVAGAQDAVSITPDGNAAVMSLATGHDQPRHVVVMHFNSKQCAATSVQHIYFEGR